MSNYKYTWSVMRPRNSTCARRSPHNWVVVLARCLAASGPNLRAEERPPRTMCWAYAHEGVFSVWVAHDFASDVLLGELG